MTFQKFEKAGANEAALLQAINEHKASKEYRWALMAIEYYAKRNPEILKRMNFLQRKGIRVDVKFHRLCSGFFPALIDQWTTYTLGDGLTLDDDKKSKLGWNFEYDLLNVGVLHAALAGVCYGFWSLSPTGREEDNKVIFFPIAENGGLKGAFPLLDDRTSNMKLFIRFWQEDSDEPMFVELFDERGIAEFESTDNGSGLIRGEFKPYKQKVYQDAIVREVVDTEGYPEIPIYPIYCNKLKQSELTEGLKSHIDAYDFALSDLVNDITNKEGIKAIVKNYGGENLQNLFDKLQAEIFPVEENAQQDVSYDSVEAPFQAKQAMLDLAERRIYADFPMPNSRMDGRGVTATEIKEAQRSLDIKSDILLWWACKFVESILRLNNIPFTPNEVDFKRRTLINDQEDTNIIIALHSEEIIDTEEAIYMSSRIPQDRKEPLLARLAIEQAEEAARTFPLQGDEEMEESTEEP